MNVTTETIVYANAVVEADLTLARAEHVQARLTDMADDDDADTARRNTAECRAVLHGQIALLETTGALDGCDTIDGKIIRAYLIARTAAEAKGDD